MTAAERCRGTAAPVYSKLMRDNAIHRGPAPHGTGWRRLRSMLWAGVLVLVSSAAPAAASEFFDLGLHARVQGSDAIVVARVIETGASMFAVERVLKGDPPREFMLIGTQGDFRKASDRVPFIRGTRELLFLIKETERERQYLVNPSAETEGRRFFLGNPYTHRMRIDDDGMVDGSGPPRRGLADLASSIADLIRLQARASRGLAEADRAYVTALKHPDPEVRMWALWEAHHRLERPSRALVDALIARWPKGIGPDDSGWDVAGLIANASKTWRVERVAPVFARILSTSDIRRERASAAMALGGAGDREYLPLLRRVAADDPHWDVRAMAYDGIASVLGPEALDDLRRGARDSHYTVRATVAGNAQHILDMDGWQWRWPPPSAAQIAAVRAFLTEVRGVPPVAPLRVLVVTGGHDYPTSFYTLFEQPGLAWDHETTTEAAFRRDLRGRYDVLVLYDMPAMLSAAGRANLQAFAESGKGIVVMHHALCSHNDWDWYRDLVGARYQVQAAPNRPPSRYKHDETIPVAIARQHPITAGLTLKEIYDETYQGMWLSPQNTVLMTTTHPLADPPLVWISAYPRSRVVAIQPGHGREAHRHPDYRALVRKAILWSGGRLR
jgi:hypothetical protein